MTIEMQVFEAFLLKNREISPRRGVLLWANYASASAKEAPK